jgi:hypothetical protein
VRIGFVLVVAFAFGLMASGAFGDPVAVITTSTDTTASSSVSSTDTTTTPSTSSSTSTNTTSTPTSSTDTTTTTTATYTPTVTTDKQDYAPGSVVTITGAGWPAGDSVTVFTNYTAGQTWSQTDHVTADGSGGFTDQVTLPTSFVSSYTVKASDASGLSATATFTDASISLEGQQCVLSNNVCTGVGDGTWTAQQLNSWRELDNIPTRVHWQNAIGSNQVVTVTFPHTKTTGNNVINGFEDLSLGAPSGYTTSGLTVTSAPVASKPAGVDNWSYTFTVNVNGSDAWIQFSSTLAAGAHYNTGSSLSLSASVGNSSLGQLQVHVPGAAPGSPDL